MSCDIERLIVAVDGGGSTCRACIAALDGEVLGRATGKSANITTDFANSRKNILDTIAMAYKNAGHSADRSVHDYAYLGLAGATVGGVAAQLEAGLNFHNAIVDGDLETTVQGALGVGDGTVAMFGTGSFYVSRQGGIDRRIGGWGFRLCDDGGGAYLGLALLRLTVKAHDGLIEHSPITRAVLNRYGGTPDQMVGFAQNATPLQFGAFAPEIVEAYHQSDPNAVAIVDGAVERLENTLYNLDALSIGRLYILGGLGPFYQKCLGQEFRDICCTPAGDALAGAIQLAQKKLLGADQ